MKYIVNIARKEFLSYLNTPTAYLVAIAFLVPTFYLYWAATFSTGEASMLTYFTLLPWFLLLLAPALTMRTLAEEKKRQTLDLLLAHPLSEWQVVAGKFLGSWFFYGLLLLLTGSIPVTLAYFGNPDFGQLMAQYLGAWLMGAGFLAVGLMVSSWVDNVITSFMLAAGICFVWVMMGQGFVLQSLPWPASVIAQEVAVVSHVDQLSRGVISLRDLVFFITAVLVPLMLATIKLMEPKTLENKQRRLSLYVGAILLFAIGVVFSVISQNWPVRWDLTTNKRYTLTDATEQTLKSLDDIVTVKLYASNQLPPQVQIARRDIVDTLQDYVRFSNGKLRLSILNPDDDQYRQEAIQEGIQQVQFNTATAGSATVQVGFFGLVINYGDRQEVIPFVNDPSNLEYQLTRNIRKLVRDNAKTLGVVSGQGEKGQFTDLQTLSNALQSEYQLTSVDLSSETDIQSYDALLVIGPTSAVEATASSAMQTYLENGGRALFMLDRTQVSPQLGTASSFDPGWGSVLGTYGVGIENNLVYDGKLNQKIQMGQPPLVYAMNYPYWLIALTNNEFTPVAGLEGVTLGWASSVQLNPVDGVQQYSLLHTSDGGGISQEPYSINPDLVPQIPGDQEVLLAAAAEKGNSRIVVVGDSDLATENFTQYQPNNVAFVTNMIDWLTAEEGALTVTKKNFQPSVLQNISPTDVRTIQYGHLIGVPLAIGIFGFIWLRRRRQRTQRKLTIS